MANPFLMNAPMLNGLPRLPPQLMQPQLMGAPQRFGSGPIQPPTQGFTPPPMGPPANAPRLAPQPLPGAPSGDPTALMPQGQRPPANPLGNAPMMGQPAQQPGGGLFATLGNPDARLALAAGLLSGESDAEAFGNAFQNLAGFKAEDRKRTETNAEKTAARNATAEYLRSVGRDDLAEMAMAGLGGEAFDVFTADRQYKLDQQKLAQDAAGGGAGGGAFGLNPVFYTDPETGQVMAGQTSKDGTFRPIEVPGGGNILSPYERAFGTAQGRSQGDFRGDAQNSLPGALQKAQYSIDILDKLIAHPGRETGTGMSGTLDPRNYVPGTDAKNFHVMRKQIEGRVFLEAFESLKGAGQITEIEGIKATQALARLDAAQSDDEWLAAARELQGILRLGMDRARTNAGQGGPPQPTQGGDDLDALLNQYAP